MRDETQGPEPPVPGQETSLGGASEWSKVEPPHVPGASTEPQTTAASNPPLEPLPQASTGALNQGPVVPPQSNPASGGADYQQVYGTGQTPPAGGYASGPQSYPPPPPGTPGMPPPPPGYPPSGAPPAGQGLSSNAAAAISYITFIPAVIFLVIAPYNRDRFVRFHAWQCIALTVVAFVIAIVFSVLGIVGFHMLWWLFHSLIDLLLFIAWLIALIKASQGQWFKIPIVGDLAQSFAGKA